MDIKGSVFIKQFSIRVSREKNEIIRLNKQHLKNSSPVLANHFSFGESLSSALFFLYSSSSSLLLCVEMSLSCLYDHLLVIIYQPTTWKKRERMLQNREKEAINVIYVDCACACSCSCAHGSMHRACYT